MGEEAVVFLRSLSMNCEALEAALKANGRVTAERWHESLRNDRWRS
jgi:hypothetical protein